MITVLTAAGQAILAVEAILAVGTLRRETRTYKYGHHLQPSKGIADVEVS